MQIRIFAMYEGSKTILKLTVTVFTISLIVSSALLLTSITKSGCKQVKLLNKSRLMCCTFFHRWSSPVFHHKYLFPHTRMESILGLLDTHHSIRFFIVLSNSAQGLPLPIRILPQNFQETELIGCSCERLYRLFFRVSIPFLRSYF